MSSYESRDFPNISGANGQFLDQVQVCGMLLSCVIGIYPNERQRKQPVTIDLCLYFDTSIAAMRGDINQTIDYAGVVKELSFILEHCEFLLIETAVEACCAYFLSTYCAAHQLPEIEAVCIRISKPTALAQGIIPAVQVVRRRLGTMQNLSANHKDSSLARQVIYASTGSHLTLLTLSPQAQIASTELPPHWNALMPLGRMSTKLGVVKQRTVIEPNDLMDSHLRNDSEKLQIIVIAHS